MTEVRFQERDYVPDTKFTYSVIAARHEGKWIYVRHHRRTTWEIPGGHIEAGETPRLSCLREVHEETGFQPSSVFYHGILTWNGFDIPSGGLYIFSAVVDSTQIIDCNEGKLAWHPQRWACSSTEVVSNLHIVLPLVFKHAPPQHYHFNYEDKAIQNYTIGAVPEEIDIDSPWFG